MSATSEATFSGHVLLCCAHSICDAISQHGQRKAGLRGACTARLRPCDDANRMFQDIAKCDDAESDLESGKFRARSPHISHRYRAG